MTIRRLGLGLLPMCVLILAACGGDDALSDEAYFAALADVAADSHTQIVALFDASLGPDDAPDVEAILAFVGDFQATFIDARAEVAALAAPSDVVPAHDAFVEAIDAVIDEIEEVRPQIEEDVTLFEDTDLVTLERYERACTALERLAADRGIHVDLICGDE
jgi:hypothetical protein